MSPGQQREAPWFTVQSPPDVMDYCGWCGGRFRKGDKAQRIEGGYGWRCEDCADRPPGGGEKP